MLTYIHDDTVEERLVSFTDVCTNQSSDGIFKHLQNVVVKLL
jgi:hypothetical protein